MNELSLKNPLFEYQRKYIEELVTMKIRGLPLDCGMGKTRILLEVMDRLFKSGEIKSVLIIAPLQIAGTVWQKESYKWGFDFTFQLLHGKTKHKLKAAHIYILNSEALSGTKLRQNVTLPLTDMLLIDESSLFRNHTSQRFKLLKQWVGHYDRRYIMTGTPTPRSYLNLWSQIYLLDRGERLGHNIRTFHSRYCRKAGYMGKVYELEKGQKEAIVDRIKDIFFHSNVKKETDIMYQDIQVTFSEEETRIYEELRKTGVATIGEGQIVTENHPQLRSILRQLSGGAIYYEGSLLELSTTKLKVLKTFVDSLDGQPLIIAYNFTHEYERIKKLFNGKVEVIKGGTSLKDRARIQDNWNAGKIEILLVQPAALAFGANLQAGGNHLCWFTLPEDYEKYYQLNCRLDRTGQEKTVVIHHLVAEKTLDEKVFEALKNKKDVSEVFLESVYIHNR